MYCRHRQIQLSTQAASDQCFSALSLLDLDDFFFFASDVKKDAHFLNRCPDLIINPRPAGPLDFPPPAGGGC